MNPIEIREATEADRERIERVLRDSWGSTTVVSRGRVYDAARLPALVATAPDGELHGLVTLCPDGAECELVSLDALTRRRGVGSALTAAAAEWARTRGCRRLWLITSNDNLDAIRFYQRRGWRLVAVHPGGADRARELKPSIPEVGEYGIPIHDELEFELVVDPRTAVARPS
ncbi:MAG TPA: GNAT family N-acetyltransferase [Solirubrobacteraceae bacterium]|jgi:GNAT superfamily N-acetyltransferase